MAWFGWGYEIKTCHVVSVWLRCSRVMIHDPFILAPDVTFSLRSSELKKDSQSGVSDLFWPQVSPGLDPASPLHIPCFRQGPPCVTAIAAPRRATRGAAEMGGSAVPSPDGEAGRRCKRHSVSARKSAPRFGMVSSSWLRDAKSRVASRF